MAGIPEDLKGQMDQLVSDSSRPSRYSASVMALATELLVAQFAQNPLQKIRHVLEAFLTLKEDERKKAVPEEKDRILLSKMRTVCYSFLDLIDMPSYSGLYQRKMAIPFSFAEKEGIEYLAPFHKCYRMLPGMDKLYEKIGVNSGGNLSVENSRRIRGAYFYLLVHLMKYGWYAQDCLSLKNEFINFMIPKIAELETKIRENFIDGNTWEAALFAYRGQSKNGNSNPSPRD
jgi:hypothetical protein